MKKGFDLIEIMIVVVILGLLAAVAIPKFQEIDETLNSPIYVEGIVVLVDYGQVEIAPLGGGPTVPYKCSDTYNLSRYDHIKGIAQRDSLVEFEVIDDE